MPIRDTDAPEVFAQELAAGSVQSLTPACGLRPVVVCCTDCDVNYDYGNAQQHVIKGQGGNPSQADCVGICVPPQEDALVFARYSSIQRWLSHHVHRCWPSCTCKLTQLGVD